MKFAADRPFANPETAARKLIELANAFEPIQDGRIYIEKINGPFDCAIAKGWLTLHESGTYIRFTEAGAALFA